MNIRRRAGIRRRDGCAVVVSASMLIGSKVPPPPALPTANLGSRAGPGAGEPAVCIGIDAVEPPFRRLSVGDPDPGRAEGTPAPGSCCCDRAADPSPAAGQAVTRSGGTGTSSTTSGGRGFLGGRPRPRLFTTMRPFSRSSPPHTPHGSWRFSAASRHGVLTGHLAQIAFARAMSWMSSEKNRWVSAPLPSLQRPSTLYAIVGLSLVGIAKTIPQAPEQDGAEP